MIKEALVRKLLKQLEQKAICTKWLDNEPSPCPINALKKCLDTKKPCKEAVLMVSLKDVKQVFNETFVEVSPNSLSAEESADVEASEKEIASGKCKTFDNAQDLIADLHKSRSERLKGGE